MKLTFEVLDYVCKPVSKSTVGLHPDPMALRRLLQLVTSTSLSSEVLG